VELRRVRLSRLCRQVLQSAGGGQGRGQEENQGSISRSRAIQVKFEPKGVITACVLMCRFDAPSAAMTRGFFL
jgi:hypothetical protein